MLWYSTTKIIKREKLAGYSLVRHSIPSHHASLNPSQRQLTLLSGTLSQFKRLFTKPTHALHSNEGCVSPDEHVMWHLDEFWGLILKQNHQILAGSKPKKAYCIWSSGRTTRLDLEGRIKHCCALLRTASSSSITEVPWPVVLKMSITLDGKGDVKKSRTFLSGAALHVISDTSVTTTGFLLMR